MSLEHLKIHLHYQEQFIWLLHQIYSEHIVICWYFVLKWFNKSKIKKWSNQSIFTNVPIKKGIVIILTRICNDYTISINLRKRLLKKLTQDTRTKKVFSFKNKTYVQELGVSMDSTLGLDMANIIMTKWEKKNSYEVWYNKILMPICWWYHTCRKTTSRIHKLLNCYDKKLQFIANFVQNEVPHLLDLESSTNGITIYQKNSNTRLYVIYTTFVPWSHSTVCINSLVTRTLKTCSSNKLPQEKNLIKTFASWIEYPKYMVNSIFCKIFQTYQEKII